MLRLFSGLGGLDECTLTAGCVSESTMFAVSSSTSGWISETEFRRSGVAFLETDDRSVFLSGEVKGTGSGERADCVTGWESS